MTGQCEICLRERKRKGRYGTLIGGLLSKIPFNLVSSDIYGPIPGNMVKNEDIEKFYIITFTDICTRWTEIAVLKEITSAEVCKEIQKTWLKNNPNPETFLSDQGRQYTAEHFRNYLKTQNIKQIFTTAYNPTGNSISERINKTIGHILRCNRGMLLKDTLRIITSRLQKGYHRVINTSPYELRYRKHPFDPEQK